MSWSSILIGSTPVLIAFSFVLAWLVYGRIGPTEYDGPPAGTAGEGVRIHVLVLGDIGRSPRMTYHALSIAKHGAKVNLVGYLGQSTPFSLRLSLPLTPFPETTPHPDLINNPNITITALPTPPPKPPLLPFLLFAPYKVLFQAYHLFHHLAYALPAAQWLLVQNPPSIPTLAIASLVSRLRNSELLIDWHNYSWTILATTRGRHHPLVYLSALYERRLAHHGALHLTVTRAMARQLRQPPYNIRQQLLPVHDRPAALFQPLTTPRTAAKLAALLPPSCTALVPSLIDGTTRLLVSSTSWTPDEDFSLLLDALVAYAASPGATPVLAVITGKGPQKEHYLGRVAELTKAGRLPGVRVETAFLPFEGYAALLACADLGVCLHKSSSGVDLPMKVVDMFGAGLPVAAYSGYESFGELVKEGENGRGFETAGELAGILERLLGDGGKGELEVLRKGAVREGSRRWDEEWDASVGVVLGFVKGA